MIAKNRVQLKAWIKSYSKENGIVKELQETKKHV